MKRYFFERFLRGTKRRVSRGPRLRWSRLRLSIADSLRAFGLRAPLLALTALTFAPVAADASCPIDPDFGGAVGLGTNMLVRNDDFAGPFVDTSSVFPSGINYFGSHYNGVYVNTNGNITFDAGFSPFTPFPFPQSVKMIAPYFGDVDTRRVPANPDDNNVYWGFDTDDVAARPRRSALTAATASTTSRTRSRASTAR